MIEYSQSAIGYLPSPESGVWSIGPVPVRAYAICILLGIVVAYWLTTKRYAKRGGNPQIIGDVAIWAIPFGIVGARLYHVLTDWPTYFGPGGRGIEGAVQIWSGGIGIWGAAAGGVLGAWIGCRRSGVLMSPVLDSVAPAFAVAQAIGRWGNWFNQELFGSPTQVPWALQIDANNRPAGFEQFETFHPTFLYESLWCLAIAGLVWWADNRFKMGHGRVAALYVVLYCLGRLVFELVRIDSATLIFGVRINVFTSIIVGLGALAFLIISSIKRPGRESILTRQEPSSSSSDSSSSASPQSSS